MEPVTRRQLIQSARLQEVLLDLTEYMKQARRKVRQLGDCLGAEEAGDVLLNSIEWVDEIIEMVREREESYQKATSTY